MVYPSSINATDAVGLAQGMATVVPQFYTLLLTSIFLIFAMFIYTTSKRREFESANFLDACVTSGFITTIISVLMVVAGLVQSNTVVILASITIVSFLISYARRS